MGVQGEPHPAGFGQSPRFSSVIRRSVIFSRRRPRMITAFAVMKVSPRRGEWWEHVVYAGRREKLERR
uniref:Uncharacterized protein n=1 Tax=Magnetococcus massalia (strain MO-1) TaxID=451514 RepID=A0A1S7LH42_MAGMO|nr:protein of unknown function [Candidatus Magnetococcus massalia]